MAIAEFSQFAGILSAALSQHHLSGFEIAQRIYNPSTCAGDLRGLLMVALRSQGNSRWEGPLGTPLGLVHWKRASSPVEAGTAGYL